MTQKDLSKTRSPILRIIEFIDEIITGAASKRRENITIVCSYACMLLCTGVLWHEYSDRDFSFLITLAGASQTLAFFLLMHKMKSHKNAAGISSKTLQMYVLMLIFRLNSTLVKNGYLPVDSTGDWAYQAADICSLLVVCWLLFASKHPSYKQSVKEEKIFPSVLCVAGCVALGWFVHPNHNLGTYDFNLISELFCNYLLVN